MIADWARVAPTVFTLQINRPDRYAKLLLHAIIRRTADWDLYIAGERIATFQTFAELDSMVPVLVNGYLNRSDV